MTTKSNEAAASGIFTELTTIMHDMKDMYNENETLRSDLDFTREEVTRLKCIIAAATQELDVTRAEVSALISRRDESELVTPNAALYHNIQRAEEENKSLKLEIQVRRDFLTSVLHEAKRTIGEVDAFKAALATDGSRAANQMPGGCATAVLDSVDYTRQLQDIVDEQHTELTRVRFAREQLERDEAAIEEQEQVILRLRQELEVCNIEAPAAPVYNRMRRLQRQRERTAGFAARLLESDAAGFTDSGQQHTVLSNTIRAGNGSVSFVHPAGIPNGAKVTPSAEQARVDAPTVLSRSFEIPCGWLLPVTNTVGPIRKLAKEHSLHQVSVGSDPLECNVRFVSQRAGESAGVQQRQQPTKATYLHCVGSRPALDRFEQHFLRAMEDASLSLNRYDGMVTYQQAFGAQQQQETAQRLLAAVNDASSDDIMTIAAPREMSVPQSYLSASSGSGRAAVTPVGNRRIQINETPMTIHSETPAGSNAACSVGREE